VTRVLLVLLIACSPHFEAVKTGARARSGPDRVPQLVPAAATWNVAAVTSDGRIVVLGEGDGTLRVFDLEQRRILRVIRRHRDAIEDLVIVPGDQRAVSVGRDGTVCSLSFATLDLEWCRKSTKKLGIGMLSLSPDGTRLAAEIERTFRSNQLSIFDLASGDVVRTIDQQPWNNYSGGKPIAWSPDGKRIAYVPYEPANTSASPIIVRDVASGSELGRIASHGMFVFTSAGLIAVAQDSAIELWQPTGARAGTLDHAKSDSDELARLLATLDEEGYRRPADSVPTDDPDAVRTRGLFALPNGEMMVHRTVRARAADFRARPLRVSAGKTTTLSQRGDMVAVSANGRWLFNGHADQSSITITASAVDGSTARSVTFPQVALLSGVITSSNQVLIGASWGLLQFDLATAAITSVRTDAPVIGIGDSGRFVITGEETTTKLWGLTQGTLQFVRNLHEPWIPGGKSSNYRAQRVLDIGCDATGACRVLDKDKVVDAATGRDAHPVPALIHDANSQISAVALSADGRRVAHGNSVEVHVTNVTNGQHLGLFNEITDITAVALSRDGARLAIATRSDARNYLEERVVVLETDTGKRIAKFDTTNANVKQLAFSWDGKRVLAGGHTYALGTTASAFLRLLDLGSGEQRTLAGHDGEIEAVSFAPNGKHALSVATDGTARVWDLTTRKSIVLTATESAWLMYDDDGHFDASRSGGSLIAAVERGRAYALDQLAIRNNRPDLVLQRIGAGSKDVNDYFRHRHDVRLTKLGIREDQLASTFASAPTVVIDQLAVANAEIEVVATLTSSSAALASYQIWVNGVPAFAGRGEPISGPRMQIRRKVPASSAQNRVEIAALSVAGVESQRAVRDAVGPPTTRGKLHYIVIGVSAYRDPRLKLGYPAKDAKDLADILDQARSSFDDVKGTILLDEQVTAATIAAAKQALQAATVDDTVIVFIAGHGTHGSGRDPQYLFVTHDFDPARKDQTGAPLSLIEGLLADIAPRRKLLLIDTCESGERDQATAKPTVPARMSSRTARALNRVDAEKQPAGAPATAARLPRTFLLDRDRMILMDLGRGNGTVMLSSSRWDEDSYESSEWGNGAFTYELKAALTSKVADADRDGVITIRELVGHVTRSVSKRTRELQHPVLSQDNPDAGITFPVR
jgi:WD40 repeat protein/uncharacterized caspase-like protein